MALRAICTLWNSGIKAGSIVGRQALQPNFFIDTYRILFSAQVVRGMALRRNKPYRHFITPEREPLDERITDENREFLQEVVRHSYVSPLKEPPPERSPWTAKTQRSGVIAKKIGVVPQWTTQGKRILTTMLQVIDNHVVSSSTPEQFLLQFRASNYSIERRRLGCMVVGAESIDPTNLTDDYVKLFEPSGLQPKRKLTKFVVTENALLQPGTAIRASHFRVGDFVDIGGKTTDRGFQGVMKRWGFKGGPATHGTTKFHRRPGSIGFSRKGKVRKGKKMPGHMGNQYRILRGLKILRINTKHDVIYVRGTSVMGPTGSWCYLWDTHLPLRKPLKNPPPMPTHYPEDEQTPQPEDIVHPDLFQFDKPTLIFEVTEEDLKVKRVGAKTALKAPGKAPPKPAAAKTAGKS